MPVFSFRINRLTRRGLMFILPMGLPPSFLPFRLCLLLARITGFDWVSSLPPPRGTASLPHRRIFCSSRRLPPAWLSPRSFPRDASSCQSPACDTLLARFPCFFACAGGLLHRVLASVYHVAPRLGSLVDRLVRERGCGGQRPFASIILVTASTISLVPLPDPHCIFGPPLFLVFHIVLYSQLISRLKRSPIYGARFISLTASRTDVMVRFDALSFRRDFLRRAVTALGFLRMS
jgi:hypothetical protein